MYVVESIFLTISIRPAWLTRRCVHTLFCIILILYLILQHFSH